MKLARNGFTLIEMLVVVVIIAILAMIVFKLVGAGGASSDRANTRNKLEQLANAIEVYRAEYGKYPPVAKNPDGIQPMRYEYPGPKEYWTKDGKDGSSSLANSLKSVPREEATVFTFGLMSYLVCRVEGRAENAHRSLLEKQSGIGTDKSHWLCENRVNNRPDGKAGDWNVAADNPRDARLAAKVAPYLKGLYGTTIQAREYNHNHWTNDFTSVWDSWDHELRYQSDPPYDSYRLWSVGPDGKDGTADDIVAGRE